MRERTPTPVRAAMADAAAGPALRRRWSGDRYSRLVGLMKIVLPGVGFGILATALMWQSIVPAGTLGRALPRVDADSVQRHEMTSPKYVGADDKNRPYHVEAKSARLIEAKSDRVMLEAPKASMTLDGGHWVAVTSQRGIFNQKSRLVELSGDVNVFHDANYTFRTDAATVDALNKTAWGDRPVVGSGPKATIEAQGFRILDKGRTVIFTGKAKVILHLDDQDMRDISGEKKPGSADAVKGRESVSPEIE